MNNLVAKHDFNRASIHKDKKKNQSESNRKQKHKKDLKHVDQ
ncbi:hypothetical protein BI036_gp075 [Morganella phage vB_MmoM_MP1]|uniref:Uncharacterized protein n=1 Tax=Morganella phage vB_MmoM_MP1 TaxID=1852628 RepID=A0A192YAC5_9CAUD|nr:hypothetical protein BI036_gp075 [Morganella phage vB_MmoM_MP1]ANM46664.1 hypothetical protein MP1_gp0075 [Morganella phage vB_MmoM_MP1]QQK88092.1 hypothetical protein [Providencia phage PSTRCR_127]QQV88948.1 hypothetical protein [Providencia phage PSTRCR_121]